MPSYVCRALQCALAVAVLCAAAPAAHAAVLGGLSELAGKSGCVTVDGALGGTADLCTAAPEIRDANSVLISKDGRFAYVNGQTTGTYYLTVLSRDPATGALTPLPGKDFCLTGDGSGSGGADTCTNARALSFGSEGASMVMSRNEDFLYAGGSTSDGVAVFRRDAATGKLTQLAGKDGCVTGTGASEDGADTCANGRFLDGVYGLAFSPDEQTLYVTNRSGAVYGVSIFRRDPATGVLTQVAGADGCWSTDATSEDGAGSCQDVRGGGYANTFSITPDGKHAYLPHYSHSSLALLGVDPATGKLTQAAGTAGCISESGSSEDGANTCQDVGTLGGVFGTLLSADGRILYASLYSDAGVSIFQVDPATGGLTPLAGTDHCITYNGKAGACVDGVGFDDSEQLTLSADGRTLYAAQYGYGVAVLSVDPATGKLTQLAGKDGCYTDDGASLDGPGTCTDIRAEGGGYQLALSPDDAFAYLPTAESQGSITVLSRQASPVCTAVGGTTPFATPFALTLPCSDPNGDPFTREIVTAPAHGSLGAIDAAGKVTFTPAAGFSGPDSFGFRGVDAASAGSAATASVGVGAAPPGPPLPLPLPVPRDLLAPVCATTGSTTISLATLSIAVRCGEAASLTAKLTLPRSVARKLRLGSKTVTIASGKGTAAANATKKIKLKLTAKARRRLRRLSRSQLKKLRPTLSITATDKAGNRRTRTKKLRLKR